MRTHKLLSRILLACSLFALLPTACGNTPDQFKLAGLPYDEAKQFYSVLRDAVEKGDHKTVAHLMLYPVGATVNGKTVIAHNEEEFLKVYDFVFTNKVIESLQKTSFDELILQPAGAMTPGGIVWIGGTRIHSQHGYVHVIRVIAINN